jgi:hypothetical protein
MTPTEIRVQWMREYGLSEEEIQESLSDDPPVSIETEQKELDAVRSLNELNNKIDWGKFSKRYAEIKKKNNFPEDKSCMVCMKCEKIVQFDNGYGYCDHFDERPKL